MRGCEADKLTTLIEDFVAFLLLSAAHKKGFTPPHLPFHSPAHYFFNFFQLFQTLIANVLFFCDN
jgi:hypothetical protein